MFQEEGSQVNESSDSSLRAWPKPPDVGVGGDSARIAAQAGDDR